MALALLQSSRVSAKVFTKRNALKSFQPMRYSSGSTFLDSYVVTPRQLSNALTKNAPTKISTSPRIIPLCAAWFLPNDPEGRTGWKSFAGRRIPTARFFDLDVVKDTDSPYPHMLPTAERFAQAMSDLGIRREDEVVVYDTYEMGIFSAPRVGWTLRVFGHPGVHVLNNFRLWVDEGFPVDTSEVVTEKHAKSDYPVPNYDTSMVVNFREMKEIAKDHGKEGSEGIQVLDVRSPGRFSGEEPEPRPGLPSGHMPGSINVPLSEILDPRDKTLLPGDQLKTIFESKGIDPAKAIISTCGTGVTAAALDTALAEAEFGAAQERRVYDGSWTEWAQRVSVKDGLIKTSI